MSHQDIAHLLIGQGISRLSDEQLSEVRLHLSSCEDCSQDWDLHARLVAEPAPAMSVTLEARCRAAVAARPGSGGSKRKAGRYVLIGTALVLAAAAAMLALQMAIPEQSPVEPTDRMITEPQSVDPAGEADAPADDEAPVEDEAGLQPAARRTRALPGFTVQMMPLIHEASDPAAQAAVQQYRAALIEQLRAVPGLTLLERDRPLNDVDAGPDFRITVTSRVSPPASPDSLPFQWHAELKVEDGHGGSLESPRSIAFDTVCEPGRWWSGWRWSRCSDAAGLAASTVGKLRVAVFPPDLALMRLLQAQMDDRAMPVTARIMALGDFVMAGQQRSGWRWNAASVRSAINIVDDTSAVNRRNALAMMRGIGHPDLIPRLLQLLDQETDALVRAEVVKILAQDFHADPAVRVALEALADSTAQQSMRQQITRLMTGAALRPEDAMGILDDTRLADAERVAQPVRVAGEAGMMAVLGDEAVLARIKELLTRMWSGQQVAQLQSPDLLVLAQLLGGTERTAAVDILIEGLRNGNYSFKLGAVSALGSSHLGEPRVRAALQDVTQDPSPGISGRAAQFLEQGATGSDAQVRPQVQ